MISYWRTRSYYSFPTQPDKCIFPDFFPYYHKQHQIWNLFLCISTSGFKSQVNTNKNFKIKYIYGTFNKKKSLSKTCWNLRVIFYFLAKLFFPIAKPIPNLFSILKLIYNPYFFLFNPNTMDISLVLFFPLFSLLYVLVLFTCFLSLPWLCPFLSVKVARYLHLFKWCVFSLEGWLSTWFCSSSGFLDF